ncbi:unnamed protein product [Paramecium sonneborni]|uniref:Attractin/MKLN-like beta-propeller domain-containing protein n=1 Tax=Paramecium sonneborni TaxID=65129 RepID=A0A8S1NL77_9CILI|nr:unnamed protein product [Paramecium sonneborni]
MSEKHRYSSQQKLPILDMTQTNRFLTEGFNINITVQSGDAQFISFRSLNELNPKYAFPINSMDNSSQLNQTIQNDLTQNKKMILMLGKTLYKQKNEYQEYQEIIMKKQRIVSRMQKQVKKVPQRIEPFSNDKSSNAIQLIPKKKVTFPLYFNGAFFSKLQHNWIPTIRENTMAADYQNKIYMFGGIGSEVLGDLIEYDIQTGKFREIKQNGDIPLNRYGHCLHSIGYPINLSTQFSYDNQQYNQINGKQLIMYGGEMQYNSALRLRENLSDTRIFDLETQTWQLLKPNTENIPESRRSFGSCIVGKGLIVMGGIRSQFSVFNDIHYLNLNICKWIQLDTQKNPFNKGLAFQQLVCIYNRPQIIFEKKDLRSKPYKTPEHEGIYCFGGCYIDENKNTQYYNNFMAILKLDQPNNSWIIPETLGKQPVSRIQHTASFVQEMNIIIIFGGRDDARSHPYFNDLFAYKIYEKEWVQLEIYGYFPRPRASHSAVAYKSQVLFFGGVSMNGYLEFSVNTAEFNQNQIRQLQAEMKTYEPITNLQSPKEDFQRPSILNKQYFSLHQITPIQKNKQINKVDEMNQQIQELSFSKFPLHLKRTL